MASLLESGGMLELREGSRRVCKVWYLGPGGSRSALGGSDHV